MVRLRKLTIRSVFEGLRSNPPVRDWEFQVPDGLSATALDQPTCASFSNGNSCSGPTGALGIANLSTLGGLRFRQSVMLVSKNNFLDQDHDEKQNDGEEGTEHDGCIKPARLVIEGGLNDHRSKPPVRTDPFTHHGANDCRRR